MTITRLIAAAALCASLAACGGNGDTEVRIGPQAVHPSPSALAAGTAVTSEPVADHATPIYTPVAGDGSQPIID